MITKVCGRCKIAKPAPEFAKFARATDGLQRWCRACHSEHRKTRYRENPEPHRRKAREYYRAIPVADRPAINRRANLMKYGLTPEAFDAMLAQQGGRCAICRTDEPGGRHGQWHIDHDHACCPGQRTCGGCLRALLCGNCNPMLGHAKDDVDRLMAAAAYLLQFQDVLGRAR